MSADRDLFYGLSNFIASAVRSVYFNPDPVLNRTTRSEAFRNPVASK